MYGTNLHGPKCWAQLASSCSLAEGQGIWKQKAPALGQDHLFPGATRQGGIEDAIPRSELAHLRSHLRDHSGAFGAKHEGQLGFVLVPGQAEQINTTTYLHTFIYIQENPPDYSQWSAVWHLYSNIAL